MSRDGPTTHLLCKNSKSGPDETCPSRGVIYAQNVHGLSRKDKQLEFLLDPPVDIMISKGIMNYCLQETWVLGNEVIMVRGHMIFLQNRCEREEGTKGRNPGVVAIILSPVAIEAWKEAVSNPPTTTSSDSDFVGRFLGIKMSFSRFYKWGKRVRGYLKLFVASIYHPVDEKEHAEFSDTLSSILGSLSKTVQFIGGHDVNANLGLRKTMHGKLIGIHGLNIRNKKGQNLLGVFNANNLRVVNSFFKK